MVQNRANPYKIFLAPVLSTFPSCLVAIFHPLCTVPNIPVYRRRGWGWYSWYRQHKGGAGAADVDDFVTTVELFAPCCQCFLSMWTSLADAWSRSRAKIGPARARSRRECALHRSEDCVLLTYSSSQTRYSNLGHVPPRMRQPAASLRIGSRASKSLKTLHWIYRRKIPNSS